MDEALLQYLWKYKLFALKEYLTTDGQSIDIVDVGVENKNSGPDFENVKIKIGNTLWVGAVEIHLKSSDWLKHGHTSDKIYDNVILHVVYENDVLIKDSRGRNVPTFEVKNLIDKSLIDKYKYYLNSSQTIVCNQSLSSIERLQVMAWLERLLIERLERRINMIESQLQINIAHKKEVFYHILAKAFGFKTNAQPMQLLAQSIPLSVLAKHKDNLLQIEAILFGQAGFLDEHYEDEYPKMLQKEYQFLKHKFNLQSLCDISMWKFARMYPTGFPTIRIAQFANLVYKSKSLLSKVLEIQNIHQLIALFSVEASTYWDTHYRFDVLSMAKRKKILGEQSIYSLIINIILPFMFASSYWEDNLELRTKVFDFYAQIPIENNAIVRRFKSLSPQLNSAMHSQALIELYQNYCLEKRCLQCNFGIQLLKG